MKTIVAFALIAPLAIVRTPTSSFEGRDETRCYYTDRAGTFARAALPNGYQLHLERSTDDTAVETACSATVRDHANKVVWTVSGFGALLDDWTGRDIDGDGSADAVIALDTGGGNRCCWTYFVMTFVPGFRQSAALQFPPFFQVDERGRTLIFESVPFYALGPTMAESPRVVLAHQFREGRLQDVTRERCEGILSGTAADFSTQRWNWDRATQEQRAASRAAAQATYDIEETRLAVTSGHRIKRRHDWSISPGPWSSNYRRSHSLALGIMASPQCGTTGSQWPDKAHRRRAPEAYRAAHTSRSAAATASAVRHEERS
jgi:hypothetical protein